MKRGTGISCVQRGGRGGGYNPGIEDWRFLAGGGVVYRNGYWTAKKDQTRLGVCSDEKGGSPVLNEPPGSDPIEVSYSIGGCVLRERCSQKKTRFQNPIPDFFPPRPTTHPSRQYWLSQQGGTYAPLPSGQEAGTLEPYNTDPVREEAGNELRHHAGDDTC